MKAFTTILFICLFPVIAFSQNSPEENTDKDQSGQKEEKHGSAKEILDEHRFSCIKVAPNFQDVAAPIKSSVLLFNHLYFDSL